MDNDRIEENEDFLHDNPNDSGDEDDDFEKNAE